MKESEIPSKNQDEIALSQTTPKIKQLQEKILQGDLDILKNDLQRSIAAERIVKRLTEIDPFLPALLSQEQLDDETLHTAEIIEKEKQKVKRVTDVET